MTIPSLIPGGSRSSGYSLRWVIVCYVLMALSAQLVGPIGSSLVSWLRPDSYETQLQTAWNQTAAVGNAIAILFFKLFQTADQQVYLFPIVAVALVAVALALTIFSRRIERQMDA